MSETILPSLNFIILFVYSAISGSWVTNTTVFPRFLLRLTKNYITSILVLVSRFPVGSSAKIKGASFTIALAIATLCC